MKIERGKNEAMLLGLPAMVFLTIAILLLPTVGMALTGLDICNSLMPVTDTSCEFSGIPYACCTGNGMGNCSDDKDLDGIPDYYECAGFTLADGSHAWGYCEGNQCANPNFNFNTNSNSAGNTLLNPSKPDLYVLLQNTDGGLLFQNIAGFPDSLFANISEPSSDSGGGLGTTVHVITDPINTSKFSGSGSLDRQLIGANATGTYPTTFTQRAVRVSENFTDNGGITVSKITCSKGCPGTAAVLLGTTTYTGVTPNKTPLTSIINTLALTTWINKVSSCSTTGVYDYATGFGTGANALCSRSGTPYACCTGRGTGNCTNVACTGQGSPFACCAGPGTGDCIWSSQDFINYYQIQNIQHEIGHQLCLAPDNIALNHHYLSQSTYTPYSGSSTGAGSLMENAAFSVCKGGVTTFYIPAIFDSSDPMKMAIAGMMCPTQ